MAEFVRHAQGISMQEAGNLLKLLEVPVNMLVEEIGNVRLVHADVSIRTELLILLHSYYPEKQIFESTEHRSTKSVRNQLNALKTEKLVFGDTTSGYLLTRTGHAAAVDQIRRLLPIPTAA
jgi:predicted transcriptional regulator